MTEREKIEAAARQMIRDGLMTEHTDERGEVMWTLTDKGRDWYDVRYGKPTGETAQ